MGRTRRVETPEPTALVASAVNLTGATGMETAARSAGRPWQAECWRFYHDIGEFRFSCDWVGSMLSKAILFAQIDKDGRPGPIKSGPPAEYVNTLFGNSEGRAEMLRNIGIHLTVAGECYLVGYDKTDEGGITHEVWEVVAISRLRFGATEGERYVDGVLIPTDAISIRLWRPDPEHPEYAISPARSILPILREIWKLTEHVNAQVNSRLAGAGIFLVPSEMTFPSPPAQNLPEGTEPIKVNDADSLMAVLYKAMNTAISDRSNASAVVPIVITAPKDAIGAIQHMTFWSELDAEAMNLRNEAIRRLALGMDMPPEVLQGSGESNHWSAWQADESAIKSHTEPLLRLIANSISEGYLRPLLRAANDRNEIVEEEILDIDLISIGVDTSEMRLRPNRSKEAFELYDRGVLSRAALLRESGFEETDIMEDDERTIWLTLKVASGSTTPELVAGALRALKAEITPVASVQEVEGEVQEERPNPSLLEHPVRDIPNRGKSERRKEIRDGKKLDPGFVAAAEQAVFRALERAGNRMKNRMDPKLLAGMDAFSLHTVFQAKESDANTFLSDAWGPNVDALAKRFGYTPAEVTTALDRYCRVLFHTKESHDYEAMEKFLALNMKEVAA